MRSSLKPPLSGNFPDVYKLGFLFCGGGGTTSFKKDQIVALHPEETTDAGPGQRPSNRCWLVLVIGFWSLGELAAAACHWPQNTRGIAFLLHSNLMPSAFHLTWLCRLFSMNMSFLWAVNRSFILVMQVRILTMISSTFAALSRLGAHTCWFQVWESMSSMLASILSLS